MENRRAVIISLICFLISLLLIAGFVQVRRSELTSEFGDEVQVVVAAENIPEYGYIRPNMLKTVTVFKNFKQPQTVSDIRDIAGKSAYVPIYAGEQVTLTKLITQDGKPVLDRQIEKKNRAVTIGVSPTTGVGRLIRPGNRVDILTAVSYETPDGSIQFEIKTIVQNVMVLATGKTIQNAVPTRVKREVLTFLEEQFETNRRKDFATSGMDGLATARSDDNYSTVTLQLSAEDAEKVIFISNRFSDQKIFFTLRNSSDEATDKIETTLLDDVLGPDSDYGLTKRKPPPPAPPRQPRFYDSRGGAPVPVD